jgi:hypothetical protein
MTMTEPDKFTTRASRRAAFALGALLGIASFLESVPAASQPSFAKANTLLFLTDYLDNVQRKTTLHYAFVKRGSLEESYSDTIDLMLSPQAGNGKRVKFNYFTGVRHQHVPPLDHAQGNPIISLFLQDEVNQMEQRTGGSWRYFQKVLKIALEDQAKVTPVRFNFGGRRVEGTQIKIAPYQEDPHRAQIEPYVDKYYVFTLSNSVPGTVYQLRSVVPVEVGPLASDRDSKVLLEEVLTLSAVEPSQF